MTSEHSEMVAPLADRVRAAASDGTPLRIRGSGSKDFYGQSLLGEILDTRGYRGIVEYTPSELVLTARSGTSLVEIEEALAAHRQYLPFEPPRFRGDATLGGVVASGLAGPGRLFAGGVRDFVLGAQLLDGRAQLLRFGGRVMKNVAGYDVSRALAGSMGTLGLILEVSLKVLPIRSNEVTLRLACSEAEALEQMCLWNSQPLPITATAWCDGMLSVRLAGAASAVESTRAKLGGTPLEGAAAATFWSSLRDQQSSFFQQQEPLWRIAVAAGVGPLGLEGASCIEWSGTLRWLYTSAPEAAIRAAAQKNGGHATLFRATDAQKRAIAVFTPRTAVAARIERNLKEAFDPHGIFNRGRIDAA